MKRSSPSSGFTLIEMITVVAIIILLAGLVIGTAGYANRKAAVERATNEIKAMGTGIDAYKIDNGTVPQNEDTDLLDPRLHFSATGSTSGSYYQKASRYLYASLTGDFEPSDKPDGKPETGTKAYYSFTRAQINAKRDSSGSITEVYYIQDPFGSAYGYSTAGLNSEQDYRKQVQKNPTYARPAEKKGFNTATYDMWSTGAATTQDGQAKWVKNWGS
jgi:prepilin-type N-terminal cleavage/methylation domain-containing protein